MAILSWGKPTIEFCPSVGGNPDGSWKKTATPKEDTTKLSQNPGEEKTATEEGGEVVDSRVGKSAFTFERKVKSHLWKTKMALSLASLRSA